MTEHTPGPWFVGATNPYPDESDEIAIMAVGRLCVAVAIPKGMKDVDPDCTVANAALIAAAPDLLKALKDIASQKLTTEWDDEGDLEFGYDTIIKVARAAVNKAEGHD